MRASNTRSIRGAPEQGTIGMCSVRGGGAAASSFQSPSAAGCLEGYTRGEASSSVLVETRAPQVETECCEAAAPTDPAGTEGP